MLEFLRTFRNLLKCGIKIFVGARKCEIKKNSCSMYKMTPGRMREIYALYRELRQASLFPFFFYVFTLSFKNYKKSSRTDFLT